LSVTNGALHNLLCDRGIQHEYRVRNGGHTWEYWHLSLHEALKFISYGFEGIIYPEVPDPVNIGNLIPSEEYNLENLEGSDMQLGIYKPSNYNSTTDSFPVMFFVHDSHNLSRTTDAIKIISLLKNNMESGKIPQSLIVEIPKESNSITTGVLTSIIDQINTTYRIVEDKKGRVLIGNGLGGTDICSLIENFQTTFNACFLFQAEFPDDVDAVEGVFYYVDLTDNCENYQSNFNLYLKLREKDIDYEYRVRQGDDSPESMLKGIESSLSYLSKKLKNQ
jgi:hypothetical protein